MDAELTLDQAVTRARQSEQIKKQQELMKTNFKAETDASVDSVRFHQKAHMKSQERQCA